MINIRTRVNTLVLTMILVIGFSGQTFAQTFELTPFAGFRLGGTLEDSVTGSDLDIDDSETYGIALDFYTTPNTTLQLLYSHQSTKLNADGLFSPTSLTDLDVDYFHLGGTYIFDHDKKLRPFIGASLGATFFRPDQPNLDSEIRFSFGLGGGMKYFFTKHLGLRLEAKGYSTLVSSNSLIFCSGGCTIKVRGDALWQFEGNAGFIFAF